MLKAVIFDLDGVIINSEPLQFKAAKTVLKNNGGEITDEELSRYVGVANFIVWSELKEKYSLIKSVKELMKMQADLRIIMLKDYNDGFVPGIDELLSELKEKRIPTAIASSSTKDFIDAVLEKLGIGSYFKIIISGDQVEKSKPFPDIFLKAAEVLKVQPEECLVIEDATHGVAAAITAGMKCIGYRNIHSGNQDLSKATMIVDSITEINYKKISKLFI